MLRPVLGRFHRPFHSIHRSSYVIAGALASIAIVCGCGGAHASSAQRAETTPPIGDLVDLVPMGATTVVVVRPLELLSTPATRKVVVPLFTAELVAGLERRTSLDMRRVRELIVAEYPSGVIALARGSFSAPGNVRAMAGHMVPVERSSDRPFLRRAGHIGTDWREVVALAEDVLAISEDEVGPYMAALIERARHGRWGEGMRSALDTEDAVALASAFERAPLSIYVPTPLDLGSEMGAGLLLARERALAVAFSATGEDHVQVDLALRGEFPPGAEENFRALASSIGMSDLGSALGIREALETLTIQTAEQSVAMQMKLPADALGRGLRVLLVAEMREAVEGPSIRD